MGKAFFQFKQFLVKQGLSAMKVCNDSCILGAYADTDKVESILDIGTGTGLLALMLAQKSKAIIDAVEIEYNSFLQASENFENSPWKERLRLFHQSIQNYTSKNPQTYDLIVCNPPFYQNHLKSPETGKNLAMHSDELNRQDLWLAVQSLLNQNGKFYVMYPPYEAEEFKKLSQVNQWWHLRRLKVIHQPGKKNLRIIDVYVKSPASKEETTSNELYIKNEAGTYTKEFSILLSPYYLIF